jgi:hypothetical protein
MEHKPIRKGTFKFPVDVEGDSDSNRIEDIYLTELGYVMVSIFNENKKVYVNYICKDIKEILPSRIKIKEVEVPRSSQQQPSRDDKFSSSL